MSDRVLFVNQIGIEEFIRLQHQHLPMSEWFGFQVESFENGTCTVRAVYSDEFLRQGGTVAGPVLMALADFATYGAIMSRSGDYLQAVTSNFSINFLRRPEPGDILADATVIRLGKRLAVGTVELRSEASTGLVAHATCTYSIPPKP